MPPFDSSQIQWREPWWPMPQDQAEKAAAELQREMCTGHVLFGRRVHAVGCRQDCDDVLFYLGETTPQFAVAHLTYQRESRPEWPSTLMFDTLDAWIEQCLNSDAEDFAC